MGTVDYNVVARKAAIKEGRRREGWTEKIKGNFVKNLGIAGLTGVSYNESGYEVRHYAGLSTNPTEVTAHRTAKEAFDKADSYYGK